MPTRLSTGLRTAGRGSSHSKLCTVLKLSGPQFIIHKMVIIILPSEGCYEDQISFMWKALSARCCGKCSTTLAIITTLLLQGLHQLTKQDGKGFPPFVGFPCLLRPCPCPV